MIAMGHHADHPLKAEPDGALQGQGEQRPLPPETHELLGVLSGGRRPQARACSPGQDDSVFDHAYDSLYR